MNCGNKFVETLHKIGYPEADALNGEDFDWLFEMGEDKSFLEWFCENVSDQHVLSEKELQAFEALQKSGQSILEDQGLDEVLKTCKTSALQTSDVEEVELVKLEKELQALQKLKSLKLQRRNKLQLLASANSHRSLRLSVKEEETSRHMKETQAHLSSASSKISNELQRLVEGVKELMSFFSFSGEGTSPPVFLCQLALENYMSQQEQSTAALTSYTRKQFFQGICEVVENSNEENFQLVDLHTQTVQGDSGVGEEMTRLQLAYACAQHQVVWLKARNSSIRSAIQWAEDNLHTLSSKTFVKEHLEAKISDLNDEISKLEGQISQINSKTLPDLIKEDTQFLNMPVVKGDFDLQITRQDYYASRQDLVCSQLIKQKASFELLQLAFEIESRKHRDIHRQLESLVQELRQSNAALSQRSEMLADTSLSQYPKPRSTIDSKDIATQRLYQLLEGENKKQQLFRTYEGLEGVARKLKQDVSSVQDEFTVSAREQALFLAKLNSGVEMLCEPLYGGGNQLLLSSPELTEQFHQVEAQLNKLNHLLMDVLADVKAKRRILETDKLQQMERHLYIYFFQDEEHLTDVVKSLEHQSRIKSIGLEG
ncbi:HAUS augmin-like complex subunit 3 [Ornithorhynchus anatinus]|uniref:HAUS augmin like complex subunit 3 n=1 Tax=Ornithorhynchus anatinus TaxID=9258 RepID=F7CJR3_ORNAN|nr:HAUS augmin-like complex subunit 3 [Ornithorhynchus anatinus]